jgi:[protein-PII] uridylyltransferase
LDEQETRTLCFLVYHHLLMAHTAFRRDPYDEKVLLTFARAVGTPEVLRKLFVLTAADIAAVGPGVLTKWKESLLIELYLRAMPEVSGEREGAYGADGLRRVVQEVAREPVLRGEAGVDESWIESQVTQFPLRYAYGTGPDRIAALLKAIRRLPVGEVLVEDSYNGALGTCEYTVITFNDLIPGLFSKIAGVMASKGLQILDAQILTRKDGVVVDTFQVVDPDHSGPPTMERRTGIARTIVRMLKGEDSVENLLGRGRRLLTARQLPGHRLPTEVLVDNETSDRLTIIDVFADDRQGLLYVITNAVFQLGLSVHAARISTRLDQVVDVFYVTDENGNKVEDPVRLEQIRASIKEEVELVLVDGTK